MQEDGEMTCKRIHAFLTSRQLRSTQVARIHTKKIFWIEVDDRGHLFRQYYHLKKGCLSMVLSS